MGKTVCSSNNHIFILRYLEVSEHINCLFGVYVEMKIFRYLDLLFDIVQGKSTEERFNVPQAERELANFDEDFRSPED